MNKVKSVLFTLAAGTFGFDTLTHGVKAATTGLVGASLTIVAIMVLGYMMTPKNGQMIRFDKA